MTKTDIRLQSLTLKNFKGVGEEGFTLTLDGKNADIYGKNATGKSTLYDSFLWLLFGKDSANRSDYQVKPQDEEGNELHHLDCSVEGVLLVNNNTLKLKRQLSEKWSKNQKTKEVEFTGNLTSYWVNDVPTKSKDYAVEIGSIIKENIFKLLTNPLFFNTNEKGWDWKERRKILFEISGNVSDADVIDSLVTVGDKSMLDLLTIINSGRTIDNHKLVISDQIKNTKSQMDGIPARISEQQRNTSMDAVDYTAIETAVQAHKATLQAIELELATNAQGASLYRQKQQLAYGLRNLIDVRKLEITHEANAGFNKKVDEKEKLENDAYSLKSLITLDSSRIESCEKQSKTIEENLVALREKYGKVQSQIYVEPNPENFNCPTCGQGMPTDDVLAKMSELRFNFDSALKIDLAKIQTDGKDQAKLQERYRAELVEARESLAENDEKLRIVNEKIVELEKAIEVENKQVNTIDYNSDPQVSSLNAEFQALQAELEKPIEDTTTELLAKKQETSSLIESLNKTLNQKEVVEKAHIRINELKAEERKLAGELSEYERHDYLIKKFTSAKVKMLEDAINNRFETVKFKLFDTLNDGTEKEVCRTLVNTNSVLVEFDGANNGGKINTGLEIINLLSEFYGASLPLFIDNAESLTSFIPVNSQVIKLIVPPSFNQLDPKIQESLGVQYGGMELAMEYWNERNSKLRVEVQA